MLLAATKIPQQIVDLRRELSEIYVNFGLKPLPLDNLLHMTLTRMMKVLDSEFAEYYIAKVEQIHEGVIAKPLNLHVNFLHRGDAYSLTSSG